MLLATKHDGQISVTKQVVEPYAYSRWVWRGYQLDGGGAPGRSCCRLHLAFSVSCACCAAAGSLLGAKILDLKEGPGVTAPELEPTREWWVGELLICCYCCCYLGPWPLAADMVAKLFKMFFGLGGTKLGA